MKVIQKLYTTECQIHTDQLSLTKFLRALYERRLARLRLQVEPPADLLGWAELITDEAEVAAEVEELMTAVDELATACTREVVELRVVVCAEVVA